MARKSHRHIAMLLMMLLLFSQVVSSTTTVETGLNELATLPSCAVSCFTEKCDLGNTTCICEVEPLHSTQTCLSDTCTLPEALFSVNITKTTCQVPVRDRTKKFNIMCLTLGLISGATVAIRLLFIQFFSKHRSLEIDDWIILTSIPLGLTCIILEVVGLTANGLGKDMWGVPRSQLLAFGHYFYVIQILYLLLIAQIKLTLCFFYLKIFCGPFIRRLLWATVVFHICFTMGFAIGVVFQCTPIDYQWTRYNWSNGPAAEGHCININAAGWGNGAVSIASDFWLLGIPLSQIRKLKLHWKKKIGVALMFLTGAIVTFISFLRLKSIPQYAKTINPTWDQWDVVWWSTIEVCAGLICTSLPAIRLVLLRIAPRVFGPETRHRLTMSLRQSLPVAPKNHQYLAHTPSADDKCSKDSPVVSLCSHVETAQSHQDDSDNPSIV